MLYGRRPGEGDAASSSGPDPALPSPALPSPADSSSHGEPAHPDLPDPSAPDPSAPDVPEEPNPDEPSEPEPSPIHPDYPGPDDPDDDDDDGEEGDDEDDEGPNPLSPNARGLDPVFARRLGVSLGSDDSPNSSRSTRDSARRRVAPVPADRGFRSSDEGGSDQTSPDRLVASGGNPSAGAFTAALSETVRSETVRSETVRSETVRSKSGVAEAANGVAEFRPDLGSFSGPLELLLYLIHKAEVDIFDIPIARLLDQFLGHVRRDGASGRLDLQQIGDYLVMAARLMEIKSRMLLPNEIEDDEDLLEAEVEDPRWSLVKQLLEFRETKERAQLLEAAHRSRSQCFERIATDFPPPEPGSLDLKEASHHDLCSAFQRVLDLLRERDSVRIVPGEEMPIEDAMAGIRERLLACYGHRLPFTEIFPPELGLRGMISYFLGILELTRLRHLRLEQSDDFGEILVILREVG